MSASVADAEPFQRRSITVDGLERSYLIKTPAHRRSGAAPLIVYLHGGGGKARMDRSPAQCWIWVAPEGIDKSWSIDGLAQANGQVPVQDDIAFLDALIAEVVAREQADPARIVLVGTSRGGFLTFLAMKRLRSRVHAAVTIISAMPSHVWSGFAVRTPTHIMMVNGTDDPLVRYQGGEDVQRGAKRLADTASQPIEATARDLAVMQGLSAEPTVTALPDMRDDGCRIERLDWGDRHGAASVTLYKMIGGGHTLPGVLNPYPQALVGSTCRDVRMPDLLQGFLNDVLRR